MKVVIRCGSGMGMGSRGGRGVGGGDSETSDGHEGPRGVINFF